jgi:hypothetical protein
LGQSFDPAEFTAAGDDLVACDAAVEQVLDDELSELSGSSGDHVRHRVPPVLASLMEPSVRPSAERTPTRRNIFPVN